MKVRFLRQNASLLCASAILLVFVLFAVFPSWFCMYDSKQAFEPWQQPSAQHILGTNDLGYDVWSELVVATKYTLFPSLIAALLATVVGVVVGICAACNNKVVSAVFSWLIDVFLAIPKLPLMVVLAAFLPKSTLSTVMLIALLSWVTTARLIRYNTSDALSAPYVTQLTILGVGKWRIYTKHILPNLFGAILARLIVAICSAILTQSTLGFLGLTDLTQPTWGSMINFAYKRGGFLREAYAWLLSPALAIALVALALSLVGRFAEVRARRVTDCVAMDN